MAQCPFDGAFARPRFFFRRQWAFGLLAVLEERGKTHVMQQIRSEINKKLPCHDKVASVDRL